MSFGRPSNTGHLESINGELKVLLMNEILFRMLLDSSVQFPRSVDVYSVIEYESKYGRSYVMCPTPTKMNFPPSVYMPPAWRMVLLMMSEIKVWL